jgi:hypothetical protein
MTAIYSKIILFTTCIIICTSTIFAQQEEGTFERPREEVVAAVKARQPYYVGMIKDELYKIYPATSQKSYYKEGAEEWILFTDILIKDEEQKHFIAFYLKDGMVSGWKKKDEPKTPEEKLQTVVDRRNKYGGASMNSSGGSVPQKERRSIYQPPRVNTGYY